MVLVYLANGCEEVEALAPVDIMRRAGLDVRLAGVGGLEITGSHGIKITADITDEDARALLDEADAIVLPGGKLGTENLEGSELVKEAIDHFNKADKLIAAICAAPSILAHRGLLKGKEATVYPTFEEALISGGAKLSKKYVVQDGNILTGRGMGVSTQFGLKLAEILVSKKEAERIRESIQWED